ncbi:type II toxin-antitoxin system RelE/ParE family toxin [Microlunatus sp. Gsoil 973]|uniref:type II toxin-antitoxin system RelE/ParE family toxin n=1 Tax=Microlunatus sp. Gsoil 973 TaxID=2672569 RepID=UPI0012B4C7A6|nr:type II toxin-antitoxin system RelE/ParE family toxin [Microlunatus sp. Gsoil 973]QGN33945.1 type II toxin-antitoxin system RelE/ParE family toxin [Microlunatus sp. Gsoil 973]
MTTRQREHPAAVEEFDAAVLWYEDRAPGTGLTLIDRAAQARADIGAWPEAAPLFPDWSGRIVVRAKAIRGFPYRIVYVVHDDSVLILAYAHEKRRPGYWEDRLDT